MALVQRPFLELKQTQKLILTQALQLSLKILQVSRLELTQLIKQELMENPLLEEIASENTSNLDSEEIPTTAEEKLDKEYDVKIQEENNVMDSFDWDAYVDNMFNPSFKEYHEKKEPLPIENTVVRTQSLYDYLLWQLQLSSARQEDLTVGKLIVGNIDDNGYLTLPLDDIAKEAGVSVNNAERVLKIVQNFEPTGVGSRNMKECITIQLNAMGKMCPLIENILENHMHSLEKKDIPGLAHSLKVSTKEVQDVVRLILSCDPKPGRQFTYFEPIYVIPDVYIEKLDDAYVIRLNEDAVPKIRINKNYYKILKMCGKKGDAENVKTFLKGRLVSAKNLIKSLNQRKSTLYRVTECIAQFQRDFLDKGHFDLKPMVLKDVAEQLGMHEATIGRTVNDKYVQTPQGLFELKFFFSSGIVGDNGNMISSTSVKEKIKQIIANENHQKPYSDAAMKTILSKSGIRIARRTVTKYREDLKIPAAAKRKRY